MAKKKLEKQAVMEGREANDGNGVVILADILVVSIYSG